ncbi:hypothetical protein Ocin01_16726 [Orchesella cincta]|uniref:Uncharacterized protein n=1 Tax=Orchesella cincta TaxID=48709 RepID=A0A1D2MAE4_ORCCI|nr:hypothetical protein Ocin01_16726 [Orchesella cincta]
MTYRIDIQSHSPCATVRAIFLFVACVVFMIRFWRTYSKSQIIENDGSWDANDINNCIEFKTNPTTDVLECNKRYGSGVYFYLGMSIIFLVLAGLVALFLLKSSDSRLQQSCQETPRRQEWSLERPVIAVSTVSTDYGIYTINNIPSAPPSQFIALSPTVGISEAALPPEYLPPPAYNECVMNMRDRV